jgi:hypothetical protein
MSAEVIKAMKQAALEDGTTASECFETAAGWNVERSVDRQPAMTSPSNVCFVLAFAPSKIGELSSRYRDYDDEVVFEAGRRIAAGYFGVDELRTIFKWKTRGRGRSRLDRNSPTEVEDALRLALAARTERSAISVLRGLAGVDVPVASAIMTAVDPAHYTILDFRALFSLGVERSFNSVGFYLIYLDACRRIAQAASVDLRTLDRALWQYSKENQKPR